MINSIQGKLSNTARQMNEIGDRSKQIGKILDKIEDLAGQTNVLALNAAIKAAKVGEHGKEFGIVADDVFQLSKKSSEATQEIVELLKDFQQTVADVSNNMQEGLDETETGVNLKYKFSTFYNSLSPTQRLYPGILFDRKI